MYGPPDEREQHPPSRSPMLHSPEEGPWALLHRTEVWGYNFIQGLGRGIFFDFVDKCECGDYQLLKDPTKKRQPSKNEKEKLVPVKTFPAPPSQIPRLQPDTSNFIQIPLRIISRQCEEFLVVTDNEPRHFPELGCHLGL